MRRECKRRCEGEIDGNAKGGSNRVAKGGAKEVRGECEGMLLKSFHP